MNANRINCQIKGHQGEIKYICTSPECTMSSIFCQQCLKDHYAYHLENQISQPFSVIDEYEISEFWFDPQIQLNQQIKDIQTSLEYILSIIQKIKDPKIESYSQFNQFGTFMKLLEKNIKSYLQDVLPLILTQIQEQMIEFEKQMLEAKSFLQINQQFKFRHDQEDFPQGYEMQQQNLEIFMHQQSQILQNKLKCIEMHDNKLYLGYENGQLIKDNQVFHEFDQSVFKIQDKRNFLVVQTNLSLFYYSDKEHNFKKLDPLLYQHKIIQEFQILTENQLVISSYNIILLLRLGEMEGPQINFDNNKQILSINVNQQKQNICSLLSDGSIQIFDQNLLIIQQIKKESTARSIQFGVDQNSLIIIYDKKLVIFDSLNNVEMMQKKLKASIKLLYQVTWDIFLWFDTDNCIFYFNNLTQKLECITSLNSGNEKLICCSNGILSYYEDNNIQKFYPLIYEQ